MAIPSREIDEEHNDDYWLDLEAIFISRTVHIHSLSPLHLPSSPLVQASKVLTQQDLETFAQALRLHLDARFNQPLLSNFGGISSGVDSNFIQQVRATFLRSSKLQVKGTPKAFAVEIEVRQPNPSQSNPNRSKLETAHLLFFSTSSWQTQTHYPVLFWKPLLSARAAPTDQQNGDNDAEAAQAAVIPRLMTSQALHFVSAYFDCRMSPLAPLHGLRGKNLEDIAQGVASHVRKQTDHLAMEMTFALPDVVDAFDDGKISEGPAPELNTISLSVPGQVAEELLSGTDIDTPIIPAIQLYLSQHTSFQLSRLTLTRVGVANVYLGAPTSTVTPGGKASSGEVRLKISRHSNDESQDDLIQVVIGQLVRVAGQEEW